MHKQKGIKIDGDWRAVVASLAFVLVFAVLPISLNESIGIENIAETLTQPTEEVNPYYQVPQGEVAGVITNQQIQENAKTNALNIPLINTQLELNKQNLLIFSVAAISTIIFILLYSILTILENRNKEESKNQVLPQNDIIPSN